MFQIFEEAVAEDEKNIRVAMMKRLFTNPS